MSKENNSNLANIYNMAVILCEDIEDLKGLLYNEDRDSLQYILDQAWKLVDAIDKVTSINPALSDLIDSTIEDSFDVAE